MLEIQHYFLSELYIITIALTFRFTVLATFMLDDILGTEISLMCPPIQDIQIRKCCMPYKSTHRLLQLFQFFYLIFYICPTQLLQ